MFSRFESLSNLPKPFELFTKKKTEEEKDQPSIREGFENTDDINKKKTNLAGFLVLVFVILFILIGLIYYFNSNILMAKQLMAQPFYTKNSFWQKFKGNMVASKVTIFFILWMIVFCNNLLFMDTVFDNHEYENIFYVTTLYFWSIVGSTMMVIGNIPSLVNVFENTVGYSILNTPLFNLNHVMSMFKNRNFKSDQFKIPYDFLITTFDIPTFHDYFDELYDQYPSNDEYFGKTTTTPGDKPTSDFYIDLNTWNVPDYELPNVTGPKRVDYQDNNKKLSDNKTLYARNELLKCVLTKNTIGHFVWVLLASYVTVLLTINTIVQ